MGVPRWSRAAIGKCAAGLYIVEPERRAYVGRRIGLSPSRPLLAAFSAAGCAYQLDTIFSKTDADVEQTGSIGTTEPQSCGGESAPRRCLRWISLTRAPLPPMRWRAAVEGRERSVGKSAYRRRRQHHAAGCVLYRRQLSTCRDFLASYVRGQAQSWLQGEACRSDHGAWEVKSLKPLKQG